MTPILLLLVAWLLIFSEFFLPGGVMATAGVVVLATSVVMAVAAGYGPLGTLAFVVVALVGTYGVCRFALWRIAQSTSESGIANTGDEEGMHASDYDAGVVGQRGEAASDLKPSGYVLVNGKRLQAISQSGYLDKGTPVEVTGGRGAYLQVKKVS